MANLGATVPSGSPMQAAFLELLLTLFLMFVVATVATDVRAVGQAAAITIGGYVALAATFAGPIAGASMNPARLFRPGSSERDLERPLGLLGRPDHGSRLGCLALPFRARGEPAETRRAGWGNPVNDGNPEVLSMRVQVLYFGACPT